MRVARHGKEKIKRRKGREIVKKDEKKGREGEGKDRRKVREIVKEGGQGEGK